MSIMFGTSAQHFCIQNNMSRDARKSVIGSSDLIRHIPACTVTEANWKLEILDFSRKGIELSE